MLRLMIIADDLTGAADTGVKFAACGPVRLINSSFERPGGHSDLRSEPEAINLAVATETRNLPAAKVPEALDRALALSGGQPPDLVYKKIDSCLRGHIGLELRHLLDHWPYQAALVAPAYPIFGRVTKEGLHYINGKPVSETELAKDPIRPVRDSNLAKIIAEGHDLPVYHLDLNLIRQGPEALLWSIDDLSRKGPALFAADAETDADLNIVAEAGLQTKNRLILAGSAGLAEALAGRMCAGLGQVAKIKRRPGPVIFFGGSASETLRKQLLHMAEHCGAAILTLDPARIMAGAEPDDPPGPGGDGRTLVVNLPRPEESPGYASLELIKAFGRQAAAIIKKLKPGTVFLSGGDTAREVLEALNIDRLWVEAEIKPGVVLLGEGEMAVVTKSGTFGDISLLKEVRELLA